MGNIRASQGWDTKTTAAPGILCEGRRASGGEAGANFVPKYSLYLVWNTRYKWDILVFIFCNFNVTQTPLLLPLHRKRTSGRWVWKSKYYLSPEAHFPPSNYRGEAVSVFGTWAVTSLPTACCPWSRSERPWGGGREGIRGGWSCTSNSNMVPEPRSESTLWFGDLCMFVLSVRVRVTSGASLTQGKTKLWYQWEVLDHEREYFRNICVCLRLCAQLTNLNTRWLFPLALILEF